MKGKSKDKKWMRRALALALRGRGRVSPNPCVGAVVVRGGKCVGKGYHALFGAPHAEVNALSQAGKKAKGATLYVTLEPCSTFGKTPPCTEAIVRSGVRRVVVGAVDPNPRHQGRGIRFLRQKGIHVEVGIEEEKARELIQSFERWITQKIPTVIVKEAVSLDGKIATRCGDSRWISSPAARRWAHQLRASVDAILVGKNTALKDNPRLTVRGAVGNGHQPVRIVIAQKGKLPKNLRLFSSRDRQETWLAVDRRLAPRERRRWERRGISVIGVRASGGELVIPNLIKELGRRGITSLLVEGGGETVARFLQAKAVDKLYFVVAPKIVGGRQAVTPVEGTGIARIESALPIKKWNWKALGKDLLIEAEL